MREPAVLNFEDRIDGGQRTLEIYYIDEGTIVLATYEGKYTSEQIQDGEAEVVDILPFSVADWGLVIHVLGGSPA